MKNKFCAQAQPAFVESVSLMPLVNNRSQFVLGSGAEDNLVQRHIISQPNQCGR